MADKAAAAQAQPAQVFSESKWDAALDTCLRRAMYGTLAGGAAALLLLREWGWVARLGRGGGRAALLRALACPLIAHPHSGCAPAAAQLAGHQSTSVLSLRACACRRSHGARHGAGPRLRVWPG